MWRKSALSFLALALTAASLAAQTPPSGGARDSALSQRLKARPGDSLGRLEVPEAAGRAQPVVTARDNSELIKALEHKIHCTCGCNLDVFTCRTTDFTCTTSPAMHQLVLARIDSGMTEAQVLDAFQKQYGEMIFMAPLKRGFNWAAYLMPFIGLGVGLGLVVGVVRRLARQSARVRATAAEAAEAAPVAGATPEEMEQLKGELERFEA
jgi:cytochrome c-type biogenesis protein CcmH